MDEMEIGGAFGNLLLAILGGILLTMVAVWLGMGMEEAKWVDDCRNNGHHIRYGVLYRCEEIVLRR